MTAGATYTPLATVTLSSAAGSITFNSISGAYTDLILISDLKNNSANGELVYCRINGDTGNNYSYTQLGGTGSGNAQAARQSSISYFRAGYTGSSFNGCLGIVHFMNYSNTNIYKTMISRYTSPTIGPRIFESAALWRSKNAITSITLTDESGYNFGIGSTATLYGIVAA